MNEKKLSFTNPWAILPAVRLHGNEIWFMKSKIMILNPRKSVSNITKLEIN